MDMRELRYRLLLIGRALCLGIAWGAVLGVAAWGVLLVGGAITDGASVDELFPAIALSPVAGFVGGIVGGGISLMCGLALALSGADVLRRMHRVRLVTGSVAAAIPLAIGWHPGRPLLLADSTPAVGVAAAAAVAAVLLASRIVTTPPPAGTGDLRARLAQCRKQPAARPDR